MNKEVIGYYNEIADQYDKDRFANSYGFFVDKQEQIILNRTLKETDKSLILDLGCGTGRLLNFCNFGIDASEKMVSIAQHKHIDKKILIRDATNTMFNNAEFQVVFSFHVLMHLNQNKVEEILNEAHRILKSGGRFIFDIPSQKRRNFVHYKPQNWHGATGFSSAKIRELTKEKWDLTEFQGTLFFPIHRFPRFIRKTIFKIDCWLCRSYLKEYSSYLVFELTKR